MGGARARVGRSRLAVLAAVALGLGLAISPAGARPVAAADPLRVAADATYTLDPAAGRVHVAIKYEVTDLKPNSAQFIYYYTGYRFGIQRAAKSIRASDGGGALPVTTKNHADYIEMTVDFRRNIYYRDTAKFTVRFDLVGGAPRSTSSIRIGKAFATWGVWAWGDSGRGTVVVNLPRGFSGSTDGDKMSTTSSSRGQTLRATPDDPERFFAILSAENPLAYTQDRLSLDGGLEIVVMAWPEDGRWDDTVSSTLRGAIPVLLELIGLDWPVTHDLNVRERYTPALEGYAGVFFTQAQSIDVSEDLDPVVIVHEASHAWFNDTMFSERWIYEGLAQEYAWRVQQSVGGDDGGLPESPNRKDPSFIRLEQWTFPQVIRDQKTDDTERYGYQASFWVVHRLVADVGVGRMREAFAVAAAHTTAYPGAGPPETLIATTGWKGFLDLVEGVDRPDPPEFDAMFRDFVLTPGEAAQLGDRKAARDAYRALVLAGAGWLPPWYVRKPMGEWRFKDARARIGEATAILDLQRQVATAATALDLVPDDALKTAYQDAQNGFGDATALAGDELAALTAIGDAKAKVEAEPDLVSKIGLLGATPEVAYEAARTAFARGDIAATKSSAAEAAAIVAGAVAIGQERLAIGAGVGFGLLVLLVVLVFVWRRGRRRRRSALALVAAAAAGPSATLAADPEAAPPSPGEPPDAEGGAPRDPPA